MKYNKHSFMSIVKYKKTINRLLKKFKKQKTKLIVLKLDTNLLQIKSAEHEQQNLWKIK